MSFSPWRYCVHCSGIHRGLAELPHPASWLHPVHWLTMGLMTPIAFTPLDAQRQHYSAPPQHVPGLPEPLGLSGWLPPDYFAGEQRYPLALFLDGQNLFNPEHPQGGWQLDQMLNQRAAKGLPVPVVVGIHHGTQREAEMSPWTTFPEQGPVHGTALLKWMSDTLLPTLHQQTRLYTGPEHTLIGGSSLGGLLALYALFHAPQHFGKALAMSPALWVGRFAIFEDLMMAKPHPAACLYLDHGEKEGNEQLGDLLTQQHHLLRDLLDILGLTPGERLCHVIDPEGTHDEVSWRKRLPAALDFLYTAPPIP
jgi:predicted alpha/beta superfamily hydrolase